MAGEGPGAERTWRIEPVAARDTYPLRHRVLRPHQPVYAGFAGDDDPDAGTLAAFDSSGEVVGCVTVRREPPPSGVTVEAGAGTGADAGAGAGTAGSWRLRGMAVDEAHRDQGIGSALLTSAVAHVARRGGTLLWCNARLPAVPFYERGGFATWGEIWEEPEIGPHLVMWRALRPSP